MYDTLRIVVFSGSALVLWGVWAVAGKAALLRGMPPKSVFLFELAVGTLFAILILAFGRVGGQL